MNIIETPLSFFPTTNYKAISQQGYNLVNITFITISSSIWIGSFDMEVLKDFGLNILL